MKRVARAATPLIGLAVLLAGCASTPDPTPTSSTPVSPAVESPAPEPTTIRIASLKGPTTMGLVDQIGRAHV